MHTSQKQQTDRQTFLNQMTSKETTRDGRCRKIRMRPESIKARKARRRRLEIRRLNSGGSTPDSDDHVIKSKLETHDHLQKPCVDPHSSRDHITGAGSTSETKGGGGLVYGHVAMMGRMRVMEDAVTVAPPEKLAGEYSFFAVYDGHGGARVSEKCSKSLHKCLEKHLEKRKKLPAEEKDRIDWAKVMAECFSSMDEEIAGEEAAERMMGSTATVVLVGMEEVVVANCGDSRAVLCRGGVPVPLSRDHKPDRPDERERVEAAGGMILNWNGWRVQGVLSTSRSLGDHYLKPYVISEPEVTVVRRTESDEFLIIATDGLWDVMCNELACQTVHKRLMNMSGRTRWSSSQWSNTHNTNTNTNNSTSSTSSIASQAAATLAEMAIAKGSRDNISVIVVQLAQGQVTC